MASTVYWVGSLTVALVVVLLAAAAWRVRRRLLPAWTGARARLAEVVIAVAVPFTVAHVVGTFGWFTRGPVLAGCVLVAVAMFVAAGPVRANVEAVPDSGTTAGTEPGGSRPEELVCAIVATAVAGAQWVMHTSDALDGGMTHGDTLWYHGPFAARFVQTGYFTHASSTGLEDLATPLHGYLPLDGSVAHALFMLPFDRDIVSPVLNLAFFGLALLAGWCIGTRRGAGALAVLGTVVVLSLPTLTGTQPGQASNDVVTAAFFFAAIALLFEGGLDPVPAGVAGLAAGLALGTKLTVLAPLAVITLGIVFLAFRSRRAAPALAWCVAFFVTGGYWLVRNWVVAGNPVPWSEVSLGPLTLDRALETRPALITVLDRADTWGDFILPGLRDALGRGWIVILACVLVGAGCGIVRGRSGIERVAGVAALTGIVALAFIPFGADFGGGIFVFMVRYLVPEYFVGMVLLALTVAGRGVLSRRVLTAVFALLVLANVTSPYIEGAQLWPDGQILTGIGAGLVIAAVAIALVRGPRRAARLRPAVAWVSVGAVAVLALGAGWFVQRNYLDARYVDAGLPHDPVNARFREVHDARVGAVAREHYYPLFGIDLSNDVSRIDGPTRGSERSRCRQWRRELDGFDFLVLGDDPFSAAQPDPEWITSDPNAFVVLRDGDETVIRLEGALDPAGCR